ncbi:MAG: PAS domain-containing protein [Rhizomicrobium sp.]
MAGKYRALDLRSAKGTGDQGLPSQLDTLLVHWLDKRGTNRVPPRAALPVQDLRPWLGHCALIDVTVHGDFRFRICGPNLIVRFGREATGMLASSLAADIAQPLGTILEAACAARAPVAAMSYVALGRELETHADLALPLSDGTDRVGALLLGSYPAKAG